jgi:hypothetical protein
MTTLDFPVPALYREHLATLLPPTWEEVPVDVPYNNVGLEEHWYRNTVSGDVWRLMAPDYPFLGLWERVW